jgi:WD40 repeat protein
MDDHVSRAPSIAKKANSLLVIENPDVSVTPNMSSAPKIEEYFKPLVKEVDELSLARAEIKAYISKHQSSFGDREWRILDRLNLIKLLQPAEILRNGMKDNAEHPEQFTPILAAHQAYTDNLALSIPLLRSNELLKPLEVYYKKFLDIFKEHLKKYQAAELSGNKDELEFLVTLQPEVSGDVVGFYRISLALAQKMSCLNEWGEIARENQFGAHATARIGHPGKDLFCKPQQAAAVSIQPNEEKVNTRLTKGEEIGVVKVKFPIKKFNRAKAQKEKPEAYKEFINLELTGLKTKEIFEKNLDLKAELEIPDFIIPTTSEIVIQVTEAINGVMLQDFLYIQYGFDQVLKYLKPQDSKKIMFFLIKNNLYQTDSFYKSKPDAKELFEDWYNFMLRIPNLEDRGKDFIGVWKEFEKQEPDLEIMMSKIKEKLEFNFNNDVLKISLEVLLNTLCLIKQCPDLMKKHYFIELTIILDSLRHIGKLFPQKPQEKDIDYIGRIFQKIPQIMKMLDKKAFATLISAYLCLKPGDGTPHNIFVVFEVDQEAQMINWWLKSFDNDVTVVSSIFFEEGKFGKPAQHTLDEVFIPYRFPAMFEALTLQQETQLLEDSPELETLKAANELWTISQENSRLIMLEIIAEKDVYEGKEQKLDIPKKYSSNFLQEYLRVTRAKQGAILENQRLRKITTLQDLLFAKEPLIAKVYEHFSHLEGGQFPILYWQEINSRDYSIENILGTKLDESIPGSPETYRSRLEKMKTNKRAEEKKLKQESLLARDLIESFIKTDLKMPIEKEKAWKILEYIAKNFKFIRFLPVSHLNDLLFEAVDRQSSPVIELLIRCGADINAVNTKGQTSLHVALQQLNPSSDLIDKLLSYKLLSCRTYKLGSKEDLPEEMRGQHLIVIQKPEDCRIFNEYAKPQKQKELARLLGKEYVQHEEHYYYIVNNEDLEKINTAIKKQTIHLNAYDNSGNPPLFSINLDNLKLLEKLISLGLDINFPHRDSKKTLLDLKLEDQNPKVFQHILLLIQHGAIANASRLYNYLGQKFKQYKESGKEDESKRVVEAVKTLINQSSEFAWLFTLDNNTMPYDEVKAKQFPHLVIEGVRSGKRLIPPAIASQIFDAQGNIKKANKDGRRSLAKTLQGLWVKEYPEQPVHQDAALLLDRLLNLPGPNVLIEGETFVWKNKEGKSVPLYLTRDASLITEEEKITEIREKFKNQDPKTLLEYLYKEGKGFPLYTVFDKPEFRPLLKFLDHDAYSKLYVLMLLINDEDNKFDNVCFVPFINKKGQIALKPVVIDFDRIYVNAVGIDEMGHRVINVKSIIYDFDEMLLPLPLHLINYIQNNIKALEVVEVWRAEMAKLQLSINKMFSVQIQRELSERDSPTNLQLIFTKIFLTRFIEKLKELNEVGAVKSKLEILLKTEPELGIIHKTDIANPRLETAIDRFYAHFKVRYTEKVKGSFVTNSGLNGIMKTMGITSQQLQSAHETGFGLKQFSEVISDVTGETANVGKAIVELKKGNIIPFRGLLQKSSFQKVIQELSKQRTPINLEILLRAYKDLSLPILYLAYQHTLTTKQLKELIKTLSELEIMDLSGCVGIDFSKLSEDLEKNSQTLQKIILNDLPTAVEIQLHLSHLRRFTAMNADKNKSSLSVVHLESESLRSVVLQNHANLKELLLITFSLEVLSLRGCDQIPLEHIEQIFSQNPKLLGNPRNLKTNYSISPSKLLWWCAQYNIFTSMNSEYLLNKDKELKLGHAAITDQNLQEIVKVQSEVKSIDVSSAFQLTMNSIIFLMRNCLSLDNIQLLSVVGFYNIKTFGEVPISRKESTAVTAFALGIDGEIFTLRDKSLVYQRIDFVNNIEKDSLEYEAPKKATYSALSLLPNGDALVGDMSGNIVQWSRTLKKPAGNPFKISGVKIKKILYLANKDILFIIPEQGQIALWSFQKRINLDISFGDHKEKIQDAVFLTKDYLACANSEGKIILWNINHQEKISESKAHERSINIIIKMGSNVLMTASDEGNIGIHKVENNHIKNLGYLKGHQSAVTALCVIKENHIIASGDVNGNIKIWDILIGTCIQTWQAHPLKITHLQLGAKGLLYSSSNDGKLKAWQLPLYEYKFQNTKELVRFEVVKLPSSIVVRLDVLKIKRFQPDLALLIENLFGPVFASQRIENDNHKTVKLHLTFRDPRSIDSVYEVIAALQLRAQRMHFQNISKEKEQESVKPNTKWDASKLERRSSEKGHEKRPSVEIGGKRSSMGSSADPVLRVGMFARSNTDPKAVPPSVPQSQPAQQLKKPLPTPPPKPKFTIGARPSPPSSPSPQPREDYSGTSTTMSMKPSGDTQ